MSLNTKMDPTSSAAAEAEVSVRLATRADMPHVLHMIQELATFECAPDGPRLSVQELVRDGFDTESPWFFTLVAELQRGEVRELVGQALCSRAYSSWTGRAFYLEDLYVRPEARRRGVAQRLIQLLCQMGVREGVTRVDWHVLENNAPALALYDRLGARDLRVTEGRAALRLDEPHIQRLAAAPRPAPDRTTPPLHHVAQDSLVP